MYQSLIASGKKRGKTSRKNRDFLVADEDQRYAVVMTMLGNGRLQVLCDDGVTRMAKIRGSLRNGPNKAMVAKSDLVIVSSRDFEDKVDLVHKYSHEEALSVFRLYGLEQLKRAWNNDELCERKDIGYIDFGDVDESDRVGRAQEPEAIEDMNIDEI